MKDFAYVFGILLLVVVLLAVMPFAFLWSLNTLFGLGVPYTLKYLFAAWLLLAVFKFVTRTDNETFRR